MTTYVVMQQRIADELSRSDLTSQIKLAIQTAIKHYERKRFYFNQKTTGTFTTQANREYYGASFFSDVENVIEIDSMYLEFSNSRLPVVPVPFEQIERAQSGVVLGIPEFFSYYAQKIRLYPMPSEALTVWLAYHYRLTALSADADTNAWMTDAEELIRQRAKRTIYLDVLRDRDGAESCAILEKEAYDGLKSETRRRTSNQRLGVDPAIYGPSKYDIRYQ